MEKKLNGSYTIEAAFVMAVVLWTMVLLIQYGYQIHDEVRGNMVLHETIERYRHEETDQTGSAAAAVAAKKAGHPFLLPDYQFQINKTGNVITGEQVSGSVRGGHWESQIESKVFDPENFLRMLTLLPLKE